MVTTSPGKTARPRKSAGASVAAAKKTNQINSGKKPRDLDDKDVVKVEVAPKVKSKLVRDSFTIPKAEYLVLDRLKLRAVGLKRPTKKGELLRAGIALLNTLNDAAFLNALSKIPSLRTGRPKSSD